MYEGFADVYDHVMDNIPYDEWFEKLRHFLEKNGVTSGTICELGCGTGTMTELMAGAGYSMIGVDESPEMLALAKQKSDETGSDILYVEKRMEEFAPAHEVDAVISVCDTLNYLINEQDLLKTFTQVASYLKDGGYFIFDLKTPYCYQYIIGNQTWVEQDDEVSYIWENYYYEDRDINEYMLTVFRRRDDDLYERIDEAHYQRAYSIDVLKDLIDKAGLSTVAVYDGDFENAPTDTGERFYVIAKKG